LHLPARPILSRNRSLRARHGNVFVIVDRGATAARLRVESGDG
jgi:hypothetical protein